MKAYRLIIPYLVLLAYPHVVYADEIKGTISIPGGFFTISTPFTGDIDLANETLSINPTSIYGSPYNTITSELLPPGTHTRTHSSSTGGTITRTGTIPDGTIGAYFVISVHSSEHQLFNAWNVSADELTFSNRPIPGDIWVGGVYDGRRVYYDFEIVPPFSEVTIQAFGGGTYECSETSGSTITLDSNPTTGGIAVLDRVEWTVDGLLVGQGTSITEYFSLGSHIVEATAITTVGETATDTINVTVIDTTQPLLEIVFLNSSGEQVTTATPGNYTLKYNVSDVCDQTPNVTGSAKPVMSIYDGDIISIDAISGDVILPTTAVEVSASVSDASGNTSINNKILTIE